MTSGDTIRGIYEAFGRGDVQAVLGSFDPGIEWREADNFMYADRNPYIGPMAVAEGVFMRIVTEVDGFTVVPQRYTESADRVAVEGHYRGTMKATGIPVDAQFVHVWDLRGGKVVAFQQYTDTKQWADAAAAVAV
jgi:ketosteroid isomerase-like protein